MEENIVENEVQEQTKRKKRSILESIINVVLIILFLLLALRILFNIFYASIYVVGDSMLPTLIGAENENSVGGDYVYINKFATPNRGDIVVVRADEKVIIKRVIGLEGDSIYLEDGDLYIMYAGETEYVLVEEDYILDEYNSPENKWNTTQVITVPEDSMYLLGDNRNISKDSRHPDYGCFEMDSLYGVVTWWSLTFKDAIYDFHNN